METIRNIKIQDLPAAWELRPAKYFFRSFTLADRAHIETLFHAKIISEQQKKTLKNGLLKLHAEQLKKNFLKPQYGDIYKNREKFLEKMIPEDFGWLSVSRARREANTIAFNLSVRNAINELILELIDVCASFNMFAQSHLQTWMPDYTYLQRAQPTSLAHYILSFQQPLLRDLDRLCEIYARVNLCPGGIGSTNGTVLNLDREYLAKTLGFDGYVMHTRDAMWQHDLPIEILSVLVSTSTTFSRLADDFHVWCSKEFNFFSLGKAYSRESVIMPQKNNPYGFSFLRGIASKILGQYNTVAISAHTCTGQVDNRTGPYFEVLESLNTVHMSLTFFRNLMNNLNVNHKSLLEATQAGFVFSTDLVDLLVKTKGIDHKSAYKIVQKIVSQGPNGEIVTSSDLMKASMDVLGRSLSLSDKEISKLSKPSNSVEMRTGPGGASPKSTSSMIQNVQRNLKKCKSERIIKIERIAKIETRLL